MIYCQLFTRCEKATTETVALRDVCRFLSDKPLSGALPIDCPAQKGVWFVTGLQVAQAVRGALPGEQVTLLGADKCAVYRVVKRRRGLLYGLRAALAFLVLFCGSCLGMAWFHSDVGMPEAQQKVFALLTGGQAPDLTVLTVSYALGVALGVCIFYAIPKKNAVTPLTVKLAAYRKDQEQAAGKDAKGEDAHGP